MLYAGIAIVVIAILAGVILTTKRNNEIKAAGIETEAVVSRIEEHDSVDSDGMRTTSYTFYVTYRTQYGETVEAKLGSGKSVDNHIGKSWYDDLYVGCNVPVKYLPDKPNYVIRLQA